MPESADIGQHAAKQVKISRIIETASGALGNGVTPRTHYMPPEKESSLDPQRVFQRMPALYAVIKALLSPTLSWVSWRRFTPDAGKFTVVNFGAGATQLDPALINLDFVAFPHIDIVADFPHPLPIRNSSVDGVISISVFEHLEKPEFAMREVTRILKPGGSLFIATPFQYPFHGAPYDFTRWTMIGLRNLIGEEFEIVASGSRGGAMGVVILALSHAAAQLFCFGSLRLYSIANFSMMALLAPLKLLDLALAKLPFDTHLCPGLYIAAKRRSKVVEN
jgi:SAM-dependent methyltransferase